MIKFFLLLALASPQLVLAKLPSYKEEEGIQLQLTTDTNKAQVKIAVVSSNKKKLVIDIHMESYAGFTPVILVQQFHLIFRNGKVEIDEAFIHSKLLGNKTYILPEEYLSGYDGAQLDSFLFSDLNNTKLKLAGNTDVKLKNNKSVSAQKFTHSENGQNIEFWIAKDIKPFPIAAIRSKGTKTNQNYFLAFDKKIVGYISPIQSKEASVLTDKIKAFLPKPNGRKSLFLP